jgi:hypothetical protein
MGLEDVIGVIDVVRAAMKTIPVIGGQLEGGVEVLLLICKHAEVCRDASDPLAPDEFRPDCAIECGGCEGARTTGRRPVCIHRQSDRSVASEGRAARQAR